MEQLERHLGILDTSFWMASYDPETGMRELRLDQTAYQRVGGPAISQAHAFSPHNPYGHTALTKKSRFGLHLAEYRCLNEPQ